MSVVPELLDAGDDPARDVERGGFVGARHDREELVATEPADRHAGRARPPAMRLATSRSTPSPDSWPSASLTSLNPSRSMKSTVGVVERAALRELLHQRGPVRQAGERVDARPVLELRLERALLGDVAEVQHERAVVAAGQAGVRAALLLELVGEVPLARDVVGERERVVGAGDVLGGVDAEHVADVQPDARSAARARRAVRCRG